MDVLPLDAGRWTSKVSSGMLNVGTLDVGTLNVGRQSLVVIMVDVGVLCTIDTLMMMDTLR